MRARPIGTDIASTVFVLPFVGHGFTVVDDAGGTFDVKEEHARKLPLLNMIRDRFTLKLASGQAMAQLFGAEALPVPQVLLDHGFTKTPLWIYTLQEADENGGKLGPVGGTVVASVLLRLMRLSPDSLLNSAPGFTPSQQLGAESDGTFSMGHLLKFVEENRASIAHAEDLKTG